MSTEPHGRRITVARMQSQVRISTLAGEFHKAIGVVLDGDENLTWEEVLGALNLVSTRTVGHLLNDDEADGDE